MSRKFTTTSLALIVSLAANFAHAAAINVDFGNVTPVYTGDAAVTGSGPTWNKINSAPVSSVISSGALVDSAGSSSGVTFTITPTAGSLGYFTLGTSDYSQTGAPLLVDDQVYVTDLNTATLVISGLTGGLYDLYVYSVRGVLDLGADGQPGGSGANADTPIPNRTTFTIGATSYITSPSDFSTTGFTLTEDYVRFTNLSPVSNQITMSFTATDAAGGGYGAMDGFQLVPVATPEPSAICLLLIGSVAMTRMMRRRGQ